MKQLYKLLLPALLLLPLLGVGQTTLAPGDVVFVGFNVSDDNGLGPTNPVSGNRVPITGGSIQDDQFQFMLLKPVAAGTKIFFTDFGWKTSGGFQSAWTPSPLNGGSGFGSASDGIISWTASNSVAAGTVIRITCKYNLTASVGSVASEEKNTPTGSRSIDQNGNVVGAVGTGPFFMELGMGVDASSPTQGDALFAYQASSARASNPTPLAGVRIFGAWAAMTGNEFSPIISDVPASLVSAGAALQGDIYTYPNAAKYDCAAPGNITTGFPRALRTALNNKTKWIVPNAGTACEGFFYDPTNTYGCFQIDLTGFLPSTCAFTVLELRIVSQPTSRTTCANVSTTFSASAINATDYIWQSSPNGTTWTSLSNGAVYSGVTSQTLTVLNPAGLNGTRYRMIASETTEPASATTDGAATLTVNPIPTLTLASPNICTPASATLTATSGLASYTYTGSNGFSSTGTASSTQVAGLAAGPYSFTVRVRDSNGCSNTATAATTVSDPLPLSLAVPAVCEGAALTLTASTGFASYTYTGSNGFRSTGTASSTTLAGLAANTYTVSVTGITTAGCRSSTFVSATVNPTPTVTLNGSAVCGTGAVSLSATSGLASYTFIGANGVIASGTSNVVSVTGVPSGTASYTVLVTNASGCSASATALVDATIPTAGITTTNNQTTFCAGSNIQLTGSGNGTFAWAGPNNFGSSNTNPVIPDAQTSASGTYTLVVTAANGCSASATVTILVNPNPAPFTVSGGGTFCPSSQTLTGPVNPNYTYQWQRSLTGIANPNSYVTFGGTVSTQEVDRSGNYRLVVTNELGCTANDTAAVSIADYVFNGSLATGDLQQTGRTNRFGVVSTCDAPKGYPGIFSTTGARFYDSYTITNPRNVPVCATIGIASRCGVNTFSVAYLGSFDPASLGANYLADPGSTFPNTGYYEATIPANSTMVVVVHEVNPGAGCAGYQLTVEVPREAEGITVVPSNGTICNGQSASLTASVANTYVWNTGATSQSITPAPTAETPYSVTLGYGNHGCTASASTTVSVQTVTANITASNSGTLTCNVPSLTLTATGADSYSFAGPMGGGPSGVVSQNSAAGTAVVNLAGTYSVSATTSGGCRSFTTITISSDQTAPSNASLTASNSGTLTCAVTSLTLTASATPTSTAGSSGMPPSLTYVFRGPAGMLAGSGTTREVSAPGTYSVIVTGANGCTALATTTVFSNTTAPTGVALTPAPSSTLTCAVPSITLTAAATGVGLSYAFAGPSGTLAGSGNQRTINAPGTYSVVVTGANGCSATSTTVISQNIVAPTASLTTSTGSSTFCSGTLLTLVAGAGTSYAFSPGATQLGGSSGNTATVNASGMYSVTVTGANGCTSTAQLSVSTVAVTSLTLVPPASVSVCEAQAVSLSVGAVGANLTYQWFKNNTPINGQMGRVLSFTNAQPADGGSYFVTVTGACGTTSTSPTTLTVRPRPAAPTLAAVSFTMVTSTTPLPLAPFVVATGTLSFSGTSGLLNPPNANISNAGVQSFSVTQTDGFGCVSLSTPFSLTVYLPLPPASQSSCRGSNVVMNVFPTATRYEWYRNGQTIANRLNNIAGVYAGATTASLTILNAQTSGTFYCKAFAANGSFSWYGPFVVSITNCGAREAAPEPELALQVRVAPNPLQHNRLRAVVKGADGQALTVELSDQQGRVVRSQRWEVAQAEQVVEWDVSQAPGGVLLLRATTDRQSQTVKVVKE
jgi:hypothetical protein